MHGPLNVKGLWVVLVEQPDCFSHQPTTAPFHIPVHYELIILTFDTAQFELRFSNPMDLIPS